MSSSEKPKTQKLLGKSKKNYKTTGNKIAEKVLRQALKKTKHGELQLIDQQGKSERYGTVDRQANSLKAKVFIHNDQAWQAILKEGSVGLGRGYIEGWWDTEELVDFLRLLNRNIRPFDTYRDLFASLSKPVRRTIHKAIPSKRKIDKENIASHYDISNEFFATFLDETMTYSSGVFLPGTTSMKQASINKIDRLVQKLSINEKHHVLEIGTGWGSFAKRVVETTACNITTTTISEEQHAIANKKFAAMKTSQNIELLNKDWRDLEGTHDRIVSVEMIEAVHWKDYKKYFQKIDSCLTPNGLVGIQAICVAEQHYERIKGTEDFIRHFVFPGGFLPSLGAIQKAIATTSLQLIDVEDFSAHYAETLRRWRKTFTEHTQTCTELGLDKTFQRLWNFYLAYCEAAFTERHCTVNQLIFAGSEWRPNKLQLRPC